MHHKHLSSAGETGEVQFSIYNVGVDFSEMNAKLMGIKLHKFCFDGGYVLDKELVSALGAALAVSQEGSLDEYRNRKLGRLDSLQAVFGGWLKLFLIV